MQTPLHLAVHGGYTRVIERLIGYGADPNMTDVSGNTPLSDVIRNRGIIKTPSEDSPQTLQVFYRCKIMYIMYAYSRECYVHMYMYIHVYISLTVQKCMYMYVVN